MAAALLRHYLDGVGLSGQVSVESAGMRALVGSRPSGGAMRSLVAWDLDISDHRGRQVDTALIQQADLILVMEESHRRSVYLNWPQALPKTLLLSEMVGEHFDIADPIGLDQVHYDATASMIEDYIYRGLPTILQRLRLPPLGTGLEV